MYSLTTRTRALSALATGRSLRSVSLEFGISRAAIREWRDRPEPVVRRTDCPRCEPVIPLDEEAYAHLLGRYLGDGCVSAMRKGVYSLRVACADVYPRLMDEAETSLLLVRPGGKVFRVQAVGYVAISMNWKHWPCLFPQHGPGPKHKRLIVLEPWQQAIVDAHPGPLLRGLFHSDGCRITNWTVRPLKGGPRRYEYPRYFFSNESLDIIGLCTRTLDAIGVHWTRPRANTVSVARRGDVARLDEIVGPKT